MKVHLLLKLRRFKLTSNRKGLSSIIGGIFMVLIAIVLSSSYFVWTLSQNTVYNDAIRQINQVDSNHMSESVTVQNTIYNVVSGNLVSVAAQVQNQGSLSIQFVTLWIRVSNETWSNYNFTSLSNMNVPSGAPYQFNVSIRVPGAIAGQGYSFASWLITARGNVVALQKQAQASSNIVVSQTTYGIGALMMDFQNFIYYNVTGSSPNYSLTPYPSGASGYSVNGATTQNAKIAFRVIFTNVDQDQRTITLTKESVLFSIFPDGPTQVRAAYWYLVKVNETDGKIQPFAPVPLAYNVSTSIYFASEKPGTLDPWGSKYPGVTPINLALVGTIWNTTTNVPFGQNLPFVSINIIS